MTETPEQPVDDEAEPTAEELEGLSQEELDDETPLELESLDDSDPVELEEDDDENADEPPETWQADAHADRYEKDPDVEIAEDDEPTSEVAPETESENAPALEAGPEQPREPEGGAA